MHNNLLNQTAYSGWLVLRYMEKANLKIRREWGWPASNTFRCPPIKSFVEYYLRQSKVSVDPFARNFTGCTYTNDLNPNTKAQYHMDALDFLLLMRDKGVSPDLVVFDPPYSPRQMQECYEGIGLKPTQYAHRTWNWSKEKAVINEILLLNGVVLHFGWTSQGMGKGYHIEELLLVCHGVGSNDTICMAERRTCEQINLFPHNQSMNIDNLQRT